MPESRAPTPCTAVIVSGTNTMPMPKDITRIHGSKSVTYDASTPSPNEGGPALTTSSYPISEKP